jgi:hypothetical protein
MLAAHRAHPSLTFSGRAGLPWRSRTHACRFGGRNRLHPLHQQRRRLKQQQQQQQVQ